MNTVQIILVILIYLTFVCILQRYEKKMKKKKDFFPKNY